VWTIFQRFSLLGKSVFVDLLYLLQFCLLQLTVIVFFLRLSVVCLLAASSLVLWLFFSFSTLFFNDKVAGISLARKHLLRLMVITAAKRGHPLKTATPRPTPFQGVWAYLFVASCPFHAFHAQITRVSAGTNWQLKMNWLPDGQSAKSASFPSALVVFCRRKRY